LVVTKEDFNSSNNTIQQSKQSVHSSDATLHFWNHERAPEAKEKKKKETCNVRTQCVSDSELQNQREV
jgi:hypothetical protein